MTTRAPAPRLPLFRLEEHFSRWEFTARHHLAASDAESLTIRELLALGTPQDRAVFEELPLGYVETRGTDALRDAIAATYETCAREDVVAFAGAEEALFWVLQLVAAPGEHVVVTVPNYQSFETVPAAAGIEVTALPVTESATGWTLDLDDLRRAIRPATRAVAVNFPQNPTGALPDRRTWLELVALCEEHGIRLVSDEVYRGIELDPDRRLPQAADLSPTAVSVNVVSKSYGLPGLRVGWVACRDHRLLDALERHKHYTSICNAGPSEHLAAVALRAGATIHARNRAIVAANVPLADELFGRFPDLFSWSPPAGGCVAFPRYHGPEGADAFCRDLVERSGVLLLPSTVYRAPDGSVPDTHVRIGLGRRTVPEALDALEQHLLERRR